MTTVEIVVEMEIPEGVDTRTAIEDFLPYGRGGTDALNVTLVHDAWRRLPTGEPPHRLVYAEERS